MFGKTQVKIESPGKKTRQGRSNRTKLAASSRNAKKKRYRGQGHDLGSVKLGRTLLRYPRGFALQLNNSSGDRNPLKVLNIHILGQISWDDLSIA